MSPEPYHLYEMAFRAHLHHGSLISEMVLFAHSLVCPLSWTTSMERARSSLGRHVLDGWWSGWSFSSLWWENGRVFLVSREEDLEDALQRFRLQGLTNVLCILEDVTGMRESHHLAQLGASSIIFFSRQSILIVSKKCVCNTTAKDINYAIVRIPSTRPRDLCFRFWLHDIS